MEWDVSLGFSNDHKRSMKRADMLAGTRLAEFLTKPQPRFVWRAALKFHGSVMIELLLDATGVAASFPGCEAFWLNEDFRQRARRLLKAPDLQTVLKELLTSHFLDFLKKTVEVSSLKEAAATV